MLSLRKWLGLSEFTTFLRQSKMHYLDSAFKRKVSSWLYFSAPSPPYIFFKPPFSSYACSLGWFFFCHYIMFLSGDAFFFSSLKKKPHSLSSEECASRVHLRATFCAAMATRVLKMIPSVFQNDATYNEHQE